MHVDGREPSPMERFGLVYCRGCEVIEVKDEDGKLMNDFTGRVKIDQKRPPRGFLRTLTVALDTAQYQADTNKHVIAGGEDVYNTFNLLMRRKPKENNFKVLRLQAAHTLFYSSTERSKPFSNTLESLSRSGSQPFLSLPSFNWNINDKKPATVTSPSM